MNIILFDYNRNKLLPLTFIRPVGELRFGTFTIKERWEQLVKNCKVGFKTENYLEKKYNKIESNNLYFINSCVFPNNFFLKKLFLLDYNEGLYLNNILLAYKVEDFYFPIKKLKIIPFDEKIIFINYPWDLLMYNSIALNFDFKLINNNKKSEKISKTNGVIGNIDQIFIDKGAKVEYTTLNTTNGPIYIGKNSEIMEGSNLRGPISLGKNSIINMGSQIYGGTTIGPYCKIGGELNNVIFIGFSNKSHNGFLGDSIIGEWCNLGANTNCSNLKNNYKSVNYWSYEKKRLIPTNIQFLGTIFGDFSKTAINTQLNTATVVGICASIFDIGISPGHIKSFSFGGKINSKKIKLSNIFSTIKIVMKRRNIIMSNIDQEILEKLYNLDIN